MCRGSRGASRQPRTLPWPSGNALSPSCRRGSCDQSAFSRPTTTGPRSVTTPEGAARRALELSRRYTTADLAVLTSEEASRFGSEETSDPQTDVTLAWELLYRLEPLLYDRLATAEHLHPGVLRWLPGACDKIVEVGAGTGRLTLELPGL